MNKQLRTYLDKLEHIAYTYEDYGVHIQTDEMRQMARGIVGKYVKEELTLS